MKAKLILAGMLISVFAFTALTAQAQAKKRQPNASQKVETTRGGSSYEVPSQDTPRAKPAASRGGACCLDFSNNTGYWVDIWVDGDYAGRLGPWESDDICVGSGFTKWYAQTAGKTYYWNNSYNCSGDITVDLNN